LLFAEQGTNPRGTCGRPAAMARAPSIPQRTSRVCPGTKTHLRPSGSLAITQGLARRGGITMRKSSSLLLGATLLVALLLCEGMGARSDGQFRPQGRWPFAGAKLSDSGQQPAEWFSRGAPDWPMIGQNLNGTRYQ